MTNYERDEERRREKMAKEIATQAMTIQSPQYDPEMRYVENDPVNHPSHYTFGSIEVLDAIEDWKLDFHSGNIIKYLVRAGKKSEDRLQDLEKAQFYINRLVKKEKEGGTLPFS